MSAIKGRGAKVRTVKQHESKKGSSNENTDSPNLSAIDRASFLEGLQLNYGNPLHSTALEEDLNVEEQVNGGKAGKKEIPQTLKAAGKQRGAEEKRKEVQRDEEGKEEEEKKKRRSAVKTSAARPEKNQLVKKGKKRKSGMSCDPEPQEPSDSGGAHQLSSEEEDGGEERSWCPSPKTARFYRLGRKSSSEKSKSKKSSSGSASPEPETASTDKQKRQRGGQGGTQLEVVLEAFLDFCDQYRESLESNTLKECVDSFSSNVENQLLEKISTSKELKVLKRENIKVASSIRTKTQRLLDAKNELMRGERQVFLLQKEKSELKARLADLRRGQAFLHDIRELNTQYLDYRHKHPKEKEMYGASSLPALLLEAKSIQAEELQPKGNNEEEQN
ncbi:centromere protein U isoform X1 [Gymnodraco acuticeps]|uniref:Centromere protein U n=1 Tax=Gymnodraco acuticeps TaxID=8218 RepID=A0A6P8VRR0_GYMAC|nr:centromere protein U isoform X1 [Gymnodraco acuticeps]